MGGCYQGYSAGKLGRGLGTRLYRWEVGWRTANKAIALGSWVEAWEQGYSAGKLGGGLLTRL